MKEERKGEKKKRRENKNDMDQGVVCRWSDYIYTSLVGVWAMQETHDGIRPGKLDLCPITSESCRLKVAQYPGFLSLTNLEIHAGRLFTFLIC